MNLFGTDGIRGEYKNNLTDETAYALGAALIKTEGAGVVVVGRDTRISGIALTEALVKGINDYGGQAINLGIVPTNAVAHFVRRAGGIFGVMISASHNPPEYNGLKVFDRYGVKICFELQQKLSQNIVKYKLTLPPSNSLTPCFSGADEAYVRDVLKVVDLSAKGIKVALDCCYGSAFHIAKTLFTAAGASVVAYCDFNKGEMINVGCGATHTNFLKEQMLTNGCQLGFAFDGDADRLAVFERDTLITPDQMLYAYAKYYLSNGNLNQNTVVGTIMTDTGLQKSLQKLGIKLVRTQVGDSNIYDAMTQNGFNLGGENSGHYLLSDYATGSDALINALIALKIYLANNSLIEYTKEYKPYFSISQDFKASQKTIEAIDNDRDLNQIIANFNQKYPSLRLVLRKSGTEPKIRVYIESKTQSSLSAAMNFVKKEVEQLFVALNN